MNGHNGKLRCLVEPGTTRILPLPVSCHLARMPQRRIHLRYLGQACRRRLHGLTSHEDLGPFGTFDQKGTAKGGTMESHYTSSMGDHGSFTLKRPQ
ncbi:MAG: hypothetical protein R3F31_07610 [Verrucomicrobiales bacterium]